MPSSHAQYMAFLGVALLVLCPPLARGRGSGWMGPVATVAYLALLLGVCASRIAMHVHTPAQVGVGVGLGAVFSWAWMDWVGEVGLPHGLDMYHALFPPAAAVGVMGVERGRRE
jgi:hypothetical protein